MSKSLDLAIQVLPHLSANARRGQTWQQTYGYYASTVGLDPVKNGMAIGMAMHVIGAGCIFAKVPVAPIHYVERADGEWQGIFESSYSEKTKVLPYWNVLATSARIHIYTEEDFERVRIALSSVLPKHLPSLNSPRKLWHFIAVKEVLPGITWLQRAVSSYEEVIAGRKRLGSL